MPLYLLVEVDTLRASAPKYERLGAFEPDDSFHSAALGVDVNLKPAFRRVK
jgi:hypothetical protein